VSKMWFADAKPYSYDLMRGICWLALPLLERTGRPSIGLDAAKVFRFQNRRPDMVGDELDPALIARRPIDKLPLWSDCSGPIKSFSAINQSRCRCPPNKTAARKLRYDRVRL
jgi:hypothetical protein